MVGEVIAVVVTGCERRYLIGRGVGSRRKANLYIDT